MPHELVRVTESFVDPVYLVRVEAECSCGAVIIAQSGDSTHDWELPREARARWYKHSQRSFDNRSLDPHPKTI